MLLTYWLNAYSRKFIAKERNHSHRSAQRVHNLQTSRLDLKYTENAAPGDDSSEFLCVVMFVVTANDAMLYLELMPAHVEFQSSPAATITEAGVAATALHVVAAAYSLYVDLQRRRSVGIHCDTVRSRQVMSNKSS